MAKRYLNLKWWQWGVGLLWLLATWAQTPPPNLSYILGNIIGLVIMLQLLFVAIPKVAGAVWAKVNSLWTDTRAQSIGIVRFFATLIIGAPLAYFAYRITEPILSRAETQAAGTQAAQTSQWLSTFGTYIVFIFLVVSFFGLVVLSLYQRRVTG